jgi:hypothetical protein
VSEQDRIANGATVIEESEASVASSPARTHDMGSTGVEQHWTHCKRLTHRRTAKFIPLDHSRFWASGSGRLLVQVAIQANARGKR